MVLGVWWCVVVVDGGGGGALLFNISFTAGGVLKLIDFGTCCCVRRSVLLQGPYQMTGQYSSMIDGATSFDILPLSSVFPTASLHRSIP